MKESHSGRAPHPPSGGPSKEIVLDAAQRLIGERGYAGLSMRALAEASGLAKATLYHHFPDKRAIYYSVLARDIELICDRLIQVAATPGDPITRLRAVMRTYLALHAEHGFVIWQALRESGGDMTGLDDLLRRYRDLLFAPIIDIISEAIDAGLARPVNPEIAVLSLFGMLHSYVLHRRLIADAAPDDDVIDRTLNLFLYGLLADESVSQDAASQHTCDQYAPRTE